MLLYAGTGTAADVGANDDTGKYASDGGGAFYAEMAALGLKQTVVTVRWRPNDPLALGDRTLLDLTVAAARAAGVNVVFATYPYPPREIEAGLARPDAFGAWLGELAARYPEVRQFVVGNEPNQPAFWRPQFEAEVVSPEAGRTVLYLGGYHQRGGIGCGRVGGEQETVRHRRAGSGNRPHVE